MSNGHKFIAGLLIGAAAGAALVLFLKSEKGRQLLSDIKEGSGKMQEDIKLKLQEFDATINDLCEKGIAFIEELEQEPKQQAS